MLDGVFLRCADDTLSSIRPKAGERNANDVYLEP
jgi:hypothetical protein